MRLGLALSIFIFTTFLMLGCNSNSSQTPDKKQAKTSTVRKNTMNQLMRRQLQISVMMVQSNLSAMQDGGGYQTWTPTKAVNKLVPLLNSANKPSKYDEQKGSDGSSRKTPQISFVANKVTRPWQIVLIPQDNESKILVEAYAETTDKPFIKQSITVSKY